MLEDIKKMEGLSGTTDFDGIISKYIESAKKDLATIGIADSKIVDSDGLIYSAIVCYVRSFINVKDGELYASSYAIQKDNLRHFSEYKGE